MDFLDLQDQLGYTFHNPELLRTALTHSSYMHENKNVKENNERLEFLGDAILGAVIGYLLYRRYPEENEGVLSAYRQQLVCENTLGRIAKTIDIGKFLFLGHGEDHQGGREKKSILSDAMEAVIAAIYLDDRTAVYAVADRLFAAEIAACESMHNGDYKSRLQQLVEQDGNERLLYRVVSVDGPIHDPLFSVDACLNSNVIGRGQGRSKQEAEQAAACEALALFGVAFS